ncbi:MAG: hypothetical protein JXM73_23620 [Anaerolineae bacterium]|nr:hypothetical protein [Anaerolineae bacterium]
MSPNQVQYNLAAIRSLILSAFTPRELWRFCKDRPAFREAVLDFGLNPSLADMADVLLEHCETRLLFDDLLAAIHESNPRQFERYQALLYRSAPLPARQIPHNLPPRRSFIGRDEEKRLVHQALRPDARPNLVSIDGIGGIGKTALALEVAYECLQASVNEPQAEEIATFDGFIWTTVRDRELGLKAVFDSIARTLDYLGILQLSVEEKQFAVRRLLRARRYLMIVDNFDLTSDGSLEDFVLQLPEPSRALITTRDRTLSEARMFTLTGLDELEALTLMRSEGRRLGLEGVEHAEKDQLLRLYQSTSGAPLSIKWAVGQIKQKRQSLTTVLSTLREAKESIFDNVFTSSWRLLSGDARKALLIMSLFATAASRQALQAVSDLPISVLDRAIEQLVDMSLIETTAALERKRRCYNLHPLTRAYCIQMRESELEQPFIGQAFERMLGYYRRLIMPPQEVKVGIPYWDGLRNYAANANLLEERDNLVFVIRELLEEGRSVEALEMFLPLVHCLGAWGLWDERLEISHRLADAAQTIGDPSVPWLWIDAIGWIQFQRREFDKCEQTLKAGRAAARRLNVGDALILADATQARIWAARGESECARREIERVLVESTPELALQSGTSAHRIVVARVVDAAAALSHMVGDVETAKDLYELELALRHSTGEYAASILVRLGHLDLQLGSYASAAEFLNQDIQGLARKDIALIHYGQALIAQHAGDLLKAHQLCRLALDHLTRLGMETEALKCREMLVKLPYLQIHRE